MIDTEQIAHWTHAIKNSGYSEKEIEADLKSLNNLLAEVKRLRFHLKDVVDELATHLGDYENEMYDWVRKMHELYGSD
tara:strand:+ start:13 stop:246 length:234 start_codon:yes stop_codon:yes gene_type:complete